MAKYYSSTFGTISGKHGNAVAVARKDGTTYIRMYAKSSNPRTEKQQAHRAKFALSSRALVPFNPIFKQTIGITNGISTARSFAFKNAIVGEYPNLAINYEKLMFSFGSLETLHNSSSKCSDGVVTINWDFDKMYNCYGDDKVNLVVFNVDANQSIHLENVACRSDRVVKVDVYDSWADSDIYLWAYLTRGDKKSDSVFVGSSLEVDRCICPEGDIDEYKEEVGVDDTHIDSPMHLGINKSIASFIMMLCNLLILLKQSFIGVNVKGALMYLAHRSLSMVGYRDDSFRFNLKSPLRKVVEVLNIKCKGIFTPIPIVDKYLLMTHMCLYERFKWFKANEGATISHSPIYGYIYSSI